MSMTAAAPIPDSPMRARWVLLLGAVLLLGFISLLVQIDMQLVQRLTTMRTLMLIIIDLSAMLVLMAYVVTARATQLWKRARTGMIGTRLQSRIVIMFCVMAIVPTITVAGFSAFFFNYGIKSWFDTRVSSALEDSVTVAGAYLEEHKSAIRSDALSLGSVIRPQLPVLFSNPGIFQEMLNEQVALYHLSEAVLFDNQHVITRSALSFSLSFERLPDAIMARVQHGEVVVMGDEEDKIEAAMRLSSSPPLYLLVSRTVDPTVLDHMESARATVAQYQKLQAEMNALQRQFLFVFVLVALLVLMAAVWAGMMLAVRLIDPLIALMAATERVRAGDYSIKVPEGRADDEVANLGRTFNRMTSQLEAQRRDLTTANRQIDERRRFTEAVLSGVSAGVIALDRDYCVTLRNRTALELLDHQGEIQEQPIVRWLPELEPLLKQAAAKPDRIASADMVVERDNARITLHVQVTAEHFNETIEGYIVTFDDITELVGAQRSAAWADVARRIAHEIKNPLTPITLSTERLRKKFSDEVTSDREGYERYLDTIARHTKDIGRMVEEFVSYARMPNVQLKEENFSALLRRAVFSEQTVHPEISYTLDAPEQVMLRCDEAQLRQVFTNLLKNAAEALEQTSQKTIRISLHEDAQEVTVTIRDNGPGFPPDKIAQLTEPYVTTRTKGTGLGLAIVKRTMEEHRGSLTLTNAQDSGAMVTLRFPH